MFFPVDQHARCFSMLVPDFVYSSNVMCSFSRVPKIAIGDY
jgi:hypothetical protein